MNDNHRMKSRLAEIDKHSTMCFHGKAIPPIPVVNPCCCGHGILCKGECNPIKACCKKSALDNCAQNQGSIRSMVESSHAQLRQSVCIKSKPSRLNYHAGCYSDEDKENKKVQEKIHSDMQVTKENFRHIQEVNSELKRQIRELNRQKVNLKEKVEYVEKQLNILIAKSVINEGGQPSKIQELISYIEAQRDMYKTSVERLLNKLDPERTSKLAHDIENCNRIEVSNPQPRSKTSPKAVLKSNKSSFRQQPSNTIYSKSMEQHANYIPNDKTLQESNNHAPIEEDKVQTKPEKVLNHVDVAMRPVEDKRHISPSKQEYINDKENSTSNENIDDILEDIIRGNCKQSINKIELTKLTARVCELEAEIQNLSSKLLEKERALKEHEENTNEGEKANEHNICCEENQRLKNEVLILQQEVDEMKFQESLRQQKSRQHISDLRDTTDDALAGFQRDLRSYQTEIENLKSELSIKESHLRAISREKDTLQNQLDEKTIQHEDLKSRYRTDRTQMVGSLM